MSRSDIPDTVASRTISVNGAAMHYLEAGTGDPLVFLHGNPTSSYLWRNVIPHVALHGRCIAVDCIGMGQSGKPHIAYRLTDHLAYIDAFIASLDLHDITFVMHDWGVAIGMHFLAQHPERVKAVAFMEGHLHTIDRWSDYDDDARVMFENLRTEQTGRKMVIEENFFVETVLQAGTRRTLSAAEMAHYRAPYLDPPSREPLLRWANEIPIAGQPADVAEIVNGYRASLANSDIPKLLWYAHPGAAIGAAEVAWCKATLRNLTAIDLGPGIHFLPEDHPEAIGNTLARWLQALG